VTDVMYIIKPPRTFPTSLDTGRRGAGAKMYRTFRSRPYARAGTYTHTHRRYIILLYTTRVHAHGHGVCVCVCVRRRHERCIIHCKKKITYEKSVRSRYTI